MVGFLAGLVSFMPSYAGAGPGHEAGCDQLAEKLKNLSPEQKAALQQQLEKSAQAYVALTAEQNQAILTWPAPLRKWGN